MCRQYVYLSLCLEHDCHSIVGKKGRNRYCEAARQARRLASCPQGLEYVVASPGHRGTVLCDECKQLKALRRLCLSSSSSSVVEEDAAAAAAVGKGNESRRDVPTITTTEEGREEGGDGGGWSDGSSSSSSNTIEEEDTGSLRFFANEKTKAQKLASAYDFDLALKQEVMALNGGEEEPYAKNQGEEEDEYLSVVGPDSDGDDDDDDSTIEYEANVPESTRRIQGQAGSRRSYYGFDGVVGAGKETTPPRPQCVTVVQEEVVVQKNKIRCDAYNNNNDAETVSSVATTATLEDSDDDGVVEINDIGPALRKEFLERHLVVRFGQREIAITPSTPKRSIFPGRRRPLATRARSSDPSGGGGRDGWGNNGGFGNGTTATTTTKTTKSDGSSDSSSSGSSSGSDDGVEKKEKSSGYGGEDDNSKEMQTPPRIHYRFVLADGGKRRRTC